MGEFPRLSARAFLCNDGKVLVSAYQDEKGPWYVLPGGGINAGEAAVDGLQREFKEETCGDINVGELKWVREYINNSCSISFLPKEFHQIELIFEVKLLSDPNDLGMGKEPDTMQTGLAWLPIQELTQKRFYPNKLAQMLNGEIPEERYLGECS